MLSPDELRDLKDLVERHVANHATTPTIREHPRVAFELDSFSAKSQGPEKRIMHGI